MPKTVIIEQEMQERWRDGAAMMCSVCGGPIFRNQARYATHSHSPKKRDAYHYWCQGGTVTIIGSPAPGVTEAITLGKP